MYKVIHFTLAHRHIFFGYSPKRRGPKCPTETSQAETAQGQNGSNCQNNISRQRNTSPLLEQHLLMLEQSSSLLEQIFRCAHPTKLTHYLKFIHIWRGKMVARIFVKGPSVNGLSVNGLFVNESTYFCVAMNDR